MFENVRIILWDVDGTLLDFQKAEEHAIRKGFERLHFGECTDEMLRQYSSINAEYWRRLAYGEFTKKEILVRRFRDFFTMYGINPEYAETFNENYQPDLGDFAFYVDGAEETVEALRGKKLQFAATNGTITAARKKLKLSGLSELLDGVFISDELGYEKPSMEYFDRVFEDIRKNYGVFTPDEVVIVGDNPASDIQGGDVAGIHTIWFNPEGKKNGTPFRVDAEIKALPELLDLLD